MISQLFKKVVKDKLKFDYITGNYNELFLLYTYNKNCFLGPFRCNTIEKDKFYSMVQYKSIKHSDKESLYKLLNKLPLFSLGILEIFLSL